MSNNATKEKKNLSLSPKEFYTCLLEYLYMCLNRLNYNTIHMCVHTHIISSFRHWVELYY